MIYAYTGLPGSGKTLSSLALLLSELRKGRHVFTNIVGLDPIMISYVLSKKVKDDHHSFNLSYVEKHLHRFTLEYGVDVGVPSADGNGNADANVPVTLNRFAPVQNAAFARRKLGALNANESTSVSKAPPVDKKPVVSLDNVYRVKRKSGITNYYNVEGLSLLIKDVMSYNETVVILDECHEYLNPENFAVLRPFVKYISMARHYGHDLILITQHINDIWGPIQKRVHETHDFFRGQLGIRTQYKEKVYYGSNVLTSPGYIRQRTDDKSLYKLYKSHDNGAKEHLQYISIWKSGKFVALLVFLALLILFFAHGLGSSSAYVDRVVYDKGKKVAVDSVHRYSRAENVIYVKYVVCGDFDCKATRPDGTTITLPLDYASGRYPLEVRKYVQNVNSYPVAPVPGVRSR